MGFEHLTFLFNCNYTNRNIIRMNLDEAALLYRGVQLSDGVILEIGRFWGGSTILLNEAANRQRKIISIDTYNNIKLECKTHITKNIELLVGDSKKTCIENDIGFLFIDGSHKSNDVWADTIKFWPKLRSTNNKMALVFYHDVFPTPGDENNYSNGVFKTYQKILNYGLAKEIERTGSSVLLEKIKCLPTML